MLKDFYKKSADYKTVQIKSNYHSHNYLCGHAGGSVSDYVKEAVRNGLEIIGISDHCLPPVVSYEPYVSPKTMRELYFPQFEQAEKLYGDKIQILRGVEIEYFEGHDEYYEGLRKNLDYIVMGEHEYMNSGKRMNSFCDGVGEDNIISYFDNVKLGLKSGYFAILAHPDLIFYRRPEITENIVVAFDDVVKTAVECNVALELNANGIRYHKFNYPTDLLIDLCKKHNARVVVSSDCHSPDDLCDECMLRLYAYAKNIGLNVVDRILD